MRLVNRYVLDQIRAFGKYKYGLWLFCGKQGGGKTYSAVDYALKLSEGNNLISNVRLNVDRDYYYISDVDDILYHLDPSAQNIVLLDEIQTLLDSRNFNKDFYSLFCQLRKRNVLIISTAQVF